MALKKGQAKLDGSMVTWTRGRCAGGPPMLRTALGRAGRLKLADVGNFDCSTGVAERSFSASCNWFEVVPISKKGASSLGQNLLPRTKLLEMVK